MNKYKKFRLQKKILNLLLATLITVSSISFIGCSEQKTEAKTDTNKTVTSQQQTNTQKENSQYEEVKVTKHVDGDTVEITHKDGKTDKVRFIGVNTPESTKEHEQYGQEASNYTKGKLLNKTVYLEKDAGDKDSYGRLLRYVWLEIPKDNSEAEIKSKMFNAILAEEGYAQQMSVAPNVKYADYFKKFCAEARTNNKGLWAINPNGTTKGDNITSAPAKNNNSSSTQTVQPTQPVQPKTESIQQPNTEKPAPQASSSENNSAVVYSTKTGECYHSDGCSSLRKSKIQTTVQNAKAAGLRPCSKCNPPQ